MSTKGLTDKLYWRKPQKREVTRHCFKRVQGGGYESLCGRHRIRRSGGQAIRRPEAWARCGICDGKEMGRRGWEESGPMTESVRAKS